MRALAAGLVLTAVLNLAARPLQPPPRPAEVRPTPDQAVEAAGFLSLGMRRLAADVALTRMLIYYGTPEKDEHGHEHGGRGEGYGGGHYDELGPRARAIMALDPSFSYATLYAAAALAFNLKRPDEALDLVAQGLKSDPGNVQYKAYAAAIGIYQQKDGLARTLELLEPTLAEPDCPTMLKSMVAFLYKRSGRREKAVALYREIAATSRDAGYRSLARNALSELNAR